MAGLKRQQEFPFRILIGPDKRLQVPSTKFTDRFKLRKKY
jgi:hypothetical protein